MTKLTDAQRVILSAASQRTDRLALPLPKSLKGGAANKVVNALVEKGFLKEVKADRKLNDPVWRQSDQGQALTLIVTDAGLVAMGIEIPASKPKKSEKLKPADSSVEAASAVPKERKAREGTKQALVIAMLRSPEGATIAEIVEATQWASHTTRGFLAGALKKKLGLSITSEKDDAKGRVYRVVK
jgi:hypothetical protein